MYATSYATSAVSSLAVITVVALLLAIAGTVLSYIFIIPKSKARELNKFWRFVHDTFNFKTLLVEHIFKALYVFLTIYMIAYGFCSMFVSFLMGILLMVLGPIVMRITYEMIMMFIILVKNTSDIRNKLCDDDGMLPADAVFSAKTAAPEAQTRTCSSCGGRVAETERFCPTCGKPVQASGEQAPVQPMQTTVPAAPAQSMQTQAPAAPAQSFGQQSYSQYSAGGFQSPYGQRPQMSYGQNGDQAAPREYRRHRTTQE